MDLVGPAGVVAQAIDRQRQIGGAAVANRLAVVERFQRGQIVDFFFDQIGQAVHQLAAIAGVHLAPGAILERFAGGLHGQIDVGGIPFGHLGNHFFGGRVDRFERLAAFGRLPLAADETLRFANLRLASFGFE